MTFDRQRQVSPLAHLRQDRRALARVLVCVFVVPFWLSLMGALSPVLSSSALGSDQTPATICAFNGVKLLESDTPPGADEALKCLACKTGACGQLSVIMRASLAAPAVHDASNDATVASIDILPRGPTENRSSHPRAPPIL